MTKKNGTINKIRNSKVFWAIASLLASFLLWAYMTSTEETTIDRTFYNVPVVFQGAEELRSSRGLIITDASVETVTIHVSGSRGNIGNLHASDLTAEVDVSSISQPREMEVSYTIAWPGSVDQSDVSIISKSPETIAFSVVRESAKTVEVKGVFTGSVADGYTADPILVEPSTITLYGPEDELKNVDSACVYVNRENVDMTLGPMKSSYVLLDQNGDEVPMQEIISDHNTVTVTLPVLMKKELPLTVNLIEGAGATADNCVVTVEPKSIEVAGDTAVLEKMNQLVVSTIDLSDFASSYENTFTIPLDNALRNLTGTTEATVKITVRGLETKKITTGNISVTGVKPGLRAELTTTMLEVTVRAETDVIDKITADNVRVVADLSDYDATTGVITVTAKAYVDGYEKAGAIGEYTVSVSLTSGG